MAELVLKGVNKLYPSGTLALYDVNMELSDGEFVAVCGGENSGKSTLLRVVSGLETADGGTIELGGKDITGMPSKDRDIAMIFNNNTLQSNMNVYENISYGLRLRKTPQALIDERVKVTAEIFGLSDMLTRKPKSLSSVQKQKVALARAVAREPRMFLLDDPLSGFDETMRAEMSSIIMNLQVRMKGTFLMVTKNLSDAMSLATRVLVLEDGFAQQMDTPMNLYDYPANEYVAFYVGSPTINFVDGVTLSRDGDGAYGFSCGDFLLPMAESVAARFAEKDGYLSGGRRLRLGIRPEDVTEGGDGFPLGGVVTGEELVGTEGYVECDTPLGNLTVRATGAKKEMKNLFLDLSRVYVFDEETRLTCLSRDSGYAATGFADADRLPLPYPEQEQIRKRPSAALKKNGRR